MGSEMCIRDSLECVNNIGEMSQYNLAISFKLHIAVFYHEFLHIYTDGSKTGQDTPVGAAFVIPQLQITNQFKLPNETSVFQAEIIAIKKAFEYIGTNLQSYPNIVICSDSKASIDAINSVIRDRMSFREVTACYSAFTSACKNHKVILQWVPAHVGIDGNERADRAAKQATKMTGPFSECNSPKEVKMIEKVIRSLDKFSFKESRN